MALKLHRDSEVGVISGELEKEGFYGEEIQFYGFAYQDNELTLVIGEDEISVAVQFYNICMQQRKVSRIITKAIRIYGSCEEIKQQKEKIRKDFVMMLEEEDREKLYQITVEKEIFLEKKDVNNCISGFTYIKNGKRFCMVNGYFPQTVVWWFERKILGDHVGDIRLKEKNKIEKISEQLLNFKMELLQ